MNDQREYRIDIATTVYTEATDSIGHANPYHLVETGQPISLKVRAGSPAEARAEASKVLTRLVAAEHAGRELLALFESQLRVIGIEPT